MYGTMYSDREDFYKITFTKAGKVNFWLGNIPSGKNHDLYVYEGQKIGTSGNTGYTSGPHLHYEWPI